MTNKQKFKTLSTTEIMLAIEGNLREKSFHFPRFFKGEVYENTNPMWFVTGPQLPNSNGVVKANFNVDTVEAEIEAALAPFRQRDLRLTWWVGPSTTPNNLGKFLQKYNLVHNRDMIGMAIDLDKLPSISAPNLNLSFETVRDKETLTAWYEVFVQGFPTTFNQHYLDTLALASLSDDDPLQNYVVWLNEQVVAVGSLFFDDVGVGLYNITTLKAARMQGLGTYATLKMFEVAQNRGYNIGSLQTTYPNALRMYHRLGFEVYCKFGIYETRKDEST